MSPVFGWLLVVLAMIGGLAVALQSGANPRLAGYNMGPAFAWTIVAVVVALLAGRRESRERKARIILLTGVVVLGIHAWYAYRTLQVGAEEKAAAAARIESNRISAAAVAEMTAIAQGAIDEVSPSVRENTRVSSRTGVSQASKPQSSATRREVSITWRWRRASSPMRSRMPRTGWSAVTGPLVQSNGASDAPRAASEAACQGRRAEWPTRQPSGPPPRP